MIRPVTLIWAEGLLDRAVAERLVLSMGLRIEGAVKDAGGKDEFWRRIGKYNKAAEAMGLVLALADHDEAGCVGPKLRRRVPRQHHNLLLRLAVRELEAWLLADAAALAEHLSVPVASIPATPDKLSDPKQTLINIARRSASGRRVSGMLPRDGYAEVVGPEYTLVMEAFIRDKWRPNLAAKRSPSLARAIRALKSATRGRTE